MENKKLIFIILDKNTSSDDIVWIRKCNQNQAVLIGSNITNKLEFFQKDENIKYVIDKNDVIFLKKMVLFPLGYRETLVAQNLLDIERFLGKTNSIIVIDDEPNRAFYEKIISPLIGEFNCTTQFIKK